MPLTYEPSPGTHIATASREAAALAVQHRRAVTFNFNDICVIAWPGDSPEYIEAQWTCTHDRKAKQWHDGPGGRKHQEWKRAEDAKHQEATDALCRRLPDAIAGSLDAVVAWCAELSEVADWCGVNWDKCRVRRMLENAGYREGENVGQPQDWFTTRDRLGRYIVGQALNCMAMGMPPHPMTRVFAERYAKLET
jgi:hypothetical protein